MDDRITEFVVFGEIVAVGVVDQNLYRARLASDPDRVYGSGVSPLEALGACVVAWSGADTAEAGEDEASPLDEPSAEPGRSTRFESTIPLATSTIAAVKPPAAKPPAAKPARPRRKAGTALAPKPKNPATNGPITRTVFGLIMDVVCEANGRHVAQIRAGARTWWGYGADVDEASGECVLNQLGIMFVPNKALSGELALSLLGQEFAIQPEGGAYTARLVACPKVTSTGPTPRRALAGCLSRWNEMQHQTGVPAAASLNPVPPVLVGFPQPSSS
jgi:hypothetical protein